MKLFVCLCAFMAAAKAGFLNFGGGSSGWNNRPNINQGGWSTQPNGNGLVYKVKVFPQAAGSGYGGGLSAGPAAPAEPQVIKFIHQSASANGYASAGHSSGPSIVAAPQVIRLIHHQASASGPAGGFTAGPASVINVVHQQGSASAAGYIAPPVPSAAPQVIKVIHTQASASSSPSSSRGYSYARAPPKLIKFIHSSSSSNTNHASSGIQQQHAGGAAKVFRVIHEQSQSQGQSYAPGHSYAPAQSHTSVPVSAPGSNYLPPLESSGPVFNAPAPVYGAPAPVYGAPAPVYGAPAPAPVYGPPVSVPAPVYGPPAPAAAPVYSPSPIYQTFTAPEPVPVHVPAETYGPPV